jgi:transposase
LQKGMIKGSYVPDSEIQDMRQLSRRYQLQRCNIRFSNYVSNQGNNKSLLKIIKSLIGGERDPVKLCGKVHGRTTNKHGKQVITDSLTGVLSKVDIEILKQCMEELEFLEKQQAQCIQLLEELANKHFAKEISLLCTIPGIQTLSAICILAELGGDLKAFATAASLIGWAGLRPRNDESAGKIISRKTMHGNRYLRQILVQAAWAASRTHKCFLGKKFSLLSKRMKSQKALMAITRKLLVIIFNVLSKKEPFDPKRNMSAKSRQPDCRG